ncbi:hypothetical protein J437_LFUL000895 [Ladona fulva]|uniref:Uncharacterized protein n=1 Tax=Ladona fulva TaxID=123851 RepID=A0A8K0K6L9_LADFU|nr:hypothetical protein J437_LFUL000895 [Ladona fulva]
MSKIKKLVRSPNLPLQQLSKRIIERKTNDNESLKIKSSKIRDYIHLGSDFNSCFLIIDMNVVGRVPIEQWGSVSSTHSTASLLWIVEVKHLKANSLINFIRLSQGTLTLSMRLRVAFSYFLLPVPFIDLIHHRRTPSNLKEEG